MASSDKTLIVLTGPTAVGKTAVSLDIAKHFGIPVINADSRQIFKELRIGTARPTEAEMEEVKHYFVGTLGIEDYYSASLYEQQVLELLDKEFQSHDYALLSGGSMMYIDAVCDGIDDIPTIDDQTRETMKRRLKEEGLEALVEELRRLDPDYYEIVDRQNPRRVVHALEICVMTGKTYTSFRSKERRSKERSRNDLKVISILDPFIIGIQQPTHFLNTLVHIIILTFIYVIEIIREKNIVSAFFQTALRDIQESQFVCNTIFSIPLSNISGNRNCCSCKLRP